jgi:uridine phosphorylase
VSDAERIPLVEDDLDQPGIIAPGAMRTHGTVPPDVVLCFFPEVLTALAQRHPEIAALHSENGRSPVYGVPLADGRTVAVAHPGVGSPMAAASLEELIVLGGRRFTAVGGAGVLVPDLVLGHAVVVSSALRDEGTSFHYLPAGRVVEADPGGVEALVAALHAADVAHTVGRTWTTDAVYRETRTRTDRRRAEGCVAVEMEASALIAVARFRGVAFSQVLFAGDSLAGEQWDSRRWTTAAEARAALVDVLVSSR